MKIIKLLFLGIVLVLFNIAYLAAQAPADTIFVKSEPVSPGDVLTITFEAHINSPGVGGIVIVIEGVPEEIVPVGDTWYTWGTGYGDVLKDEAGLQPNIVLLDATGLQLSLLSFDLDGLAADGDITSKSGELISYQVQVPEDMDFGTYELTGADAGVVLLKYPFTGANLDPPPAAVIQPISVVDIPDSNGIELPEITEVIGTGGVLSLPVHIQNKDEVGSGSFKVTYPTAAMTFTGITAGTRAGGMTFTIAEIDSVSAVDTVTVTVAFSGGSIAMGGLDELCSLEFDVSALSAGDPISISLADVLLSDAVGASLPDIQQPPSTPVEPVVFYGDTLTVGVISGAHQPDSADEASGIAVITDGQLHLPVLLKNTKPIAVLDFFIQKIPANDSITLSLDVDGVGGGIQSTARTTGWTIQAFDTTGYIHVVGIPPTLTDAMAAGEGEILTLIFDIGGWETVITDYTQSVDVSLLLKGVELIADDGSRLPVQPIDGVATIDRRVPLDGEGLGGGASLPKSFALSQNHPNPFNPSTTINYQIPEDAGVVSFSLNIYDIRGRLVRTLANEVKGPGYYTAYWNGFDNNGRQVSSGVYFYRFYSNNYTSTRKMVLLK
jgi:hypothetical protein